MTTSLVVSRVKLQAMYAAGLPIDADVKGLHRLGYNGASRRFTSTQTGKLGVRQRIALPAS